MSVSCPLLPCSPTYPMVETMGPCSATLSAVGGMPPSSTSSSGVVGSGEPGARSPCAARAVPPGIMPVQACSDSRAPHVATPPRLLPAAFSSTADGSPLTSPSPVPQPVAPASRRALARPLANDVSAAAAATVASVAATAATASAAATAAAVATTAPPPSPPPPLWLRWRCMTLKLAVLPPGCPPNSPRGKVVGAGCGACGPPARPIMPRALASRCSGSSGGVDPGSLDPSSLPDALLSVPPPCSLDPARVLGDRMPASAPSADVGAAAAAAAAVPALSRTPRLDSGSAAAAAVPGLSAPAAGTPAIAAAAATATAPPPPLVAVSCCSISARQHLSKRLSAPAGGSSGGMTLPSRLLLPVQLLAPPPPPPPRRSPPVLAREPSERDGSVMPPPGRRSLAVNLRTPPSRACSALLACLPSAAPTADARSHELGLRRGAVAPAWQSRRRHRCQRPERRLWLQPQRPHLAQQHPHLNPNLQPERPRVGAWRSGGRRPGQRAPPACRLLRRPQQQQQPARCPKPRPWPRLPCGFPRLPLPLRRRRRCSCHCRVPCASGCPQCCVRPRARAAPSRPEPVPAAASLRRRLLAGCRLSQTAAAAAEQSPAAAAGAAPHLAGCLRQRALRLPGSAPALQADRPGPGPRTAAADSPSCAALAFGREAPRPFCRLLQRQKEGRSGTVQRRAGKGKGEAGRLSTE
eukprot:365192-Chlamydomonas_euryale.AAC.2